MKFQKCLLDGLCESVGAATSIRTLAKRVSSRLPCLLAWIFDLHQMSQALTMASKLDIE